MDYALITNKYYSKWVGIDDILNNSFLGVEFIYSSERNKTQSGYHRQYDLYAFMQNERIIFSYGDKAKESISKIKNEISSIISISDTKEILKTHFGDHIEHHIKYVFNNTPDIVIKSRPLTIYEYHKYLQFFINVNPNCKNTDWLKEYFEEMVRDHLCCGLFADNILVSCSDLPSMPYMQNEVQEIGINTLNEYKGNGFATDVCVSSVNELLNNYKCPQWSTSIDNIASQKLAKKVGFIKLADVLTVTI